MKLRNLAPAFLVASATASAIAYTQPAHANLTYRIYESGADVIVETSGSLNLTGATYVGPFSCSADGAIISYLSVICTGPNETNPGYKITGPSVLDGSISIFPASSVAGITTIIAGDYPTYSIDSSYISGEPIISSATFANTTLTALGFTTTGLLGTWSLDGTGETIRLVAEVPSPWPMLGVGAALGWSRRLRRRIAPRRTYRPAA